jgi:hypothetical protein
MIVLSSVRAMMAGMIDYAGLFPPAGLSMSSAMERYLDHRSGPEGWMLAAFVCPVGRLDELAPLLGRIQRGAEPLTLALLGRGGETLDEFLRGIEADLSTVQEFAAAHRGRVVAGQIELRLPEPPETYSEAVAGAVAVLEDSAEALAPFFETSLLEGWRNRLPGALDAVAGVSRPGRAAGLKIRCGGLEATAVPSAVAVTAAIVGCQRAGLPLKATQGLHHPLRHFDAHLETTAHGFLNLFAAGILAHHHSLTEERLLAVIEEENEAVFEFSESGFSWREWRVDVDGITASRRTAVTSFGSCSFTEPRDDLRRMGLLNLAAAPRRQQ